MSQGYNNACDINFFESQDGLLHFQGNETPPRAGATVRWTSTTSFLALPELDGKTGLLLLQKNNGYLEFQTIRSTGQSFIVAELENTNLPYSGDINLGRTTSMNSLNLVNAFDGLGGTEVSVLQFLNGTFVNIAGVTQPEVSLRGFDANFADFRGIGRADCLFSNYNVSSRELELYILPCKGSVDAPADFILGYTGGLGATLSASYAPLTDSTIYEASTSSSRAANPYVNALYRISSSHLTSHSSNTRLSPAPSMMGGTRTQLIHFPKLVVKELISCVLPSVNPDIVSKSEYLYKNGRVSFDGRGWIGFENIVQRSYVLGTVTTNTYSQEFPFIGQTLNTEIRDLSEPGNILKSIIVHKGELVYAAGISSLRIG